MSAAVQDKPKSKVASVKSLRKLTKQFGKHINTCKTCKNADKANVESNLIMIEPLCDKGTVRLMATLSRMERFEKAATTKLVEKTK